MPHELVIAIGDVTDAKVSSQVFVMSHSLSTFRVGCVDPEASNYDPSAQIDDEPTSCIYKDTVVWLDCDHNPSYDLIDWSQTDCIGTLSGSRCDVRLSLSLFFHTITHSKTNHSGNMYGRLHFGASTLLQQLMD